MSTKRCMGCMEELAEWTCVCPHCRYDQTQGSNPEFALPAGSNLHAGKYLVGKVLGQGGFGITYIGLDVPLNMKVAIKEYYPQTMVSRSEGATTLIWHTADRDRGRESFIREAQKMAKINEIPHVAQVKDIFYQNETAYIVMNFIEGETLKSRLERTGPMKEQECKELLQPIMKSLSEAHKLGLVHRDISPDNIMIDKRGQVWLLDMGAAKELDGSISAPNLSESTHLVVRHGFSPIEQFSDSGRVGPWTDVYAMSATIYYCLTGKVPTDSLNRLTDAALPFAESISPSVRQILEKGMALRPEDRIQNMDELSDALAGVIAIKRERIIDQFLNYVKQNKKISIAAALAVVCLGGILALWSNSDPEPDPPPTKIGSGDVRDPALFVEKLGTSNANMSNYGGWAVIEDEYEYYIAGDNALYLCRFDQENQSFYLNDAEKVCDDAGFITMDDQYIYFLATFENETNAVCRMNQDGSNIAKLHETSDGRTFRFLQYAKLSNGEDRLYYLLENEEGEYTATLYCYDLDTNQYLETLSGNLLWYNLYHDAIYYTELGDSRDFVLMKSNLDGADAEELNRNKQFTFGFVDDDLIYIYSIQDEAILVYNLDGTQNTDMGGFYDLDINYNNNITFGYENGWIYYSSLSDNSIHRIRVNGTGDSVAIDGHTAIQLCCDNSLLWFIEEVPGEKEHQTMLQMYVSGRNGGWIYDIQDAVPSWGLSTAPISDFDYEMDDEGEGIVITGYHGNYTSFEIPDSFGGKAVTAIGESAFKESEIEEIALPTGVRRIDESAFYHCEELSFVGFPEGLESIGNVAFGNCPKLAAADLPDSLISLGSLAFAESALSTVYIPAGLEDMSAGCFAMRHSAGLTEFTVSPDNKTFEAIDGVLYSNGFSSGPVLMAYPSGKEATSYTIPDGVVGIQGYAFAHAKDLTEINIPESVLVIKGQVFFGTGITQIAVSDLCELPDNFGKEVAILYKGTRHFTVTEDGEPEPAN